MQIQFPEIHAAIANLALGDSFAFQTFDRRSLNRIRAEIAYFYQGTLKAHDDRLNDPNFTNLHDLSWDWRIEDSFTRNPDTSSLWDITLTKVPTPDKWLYDGEELKKQNEYRAALALIAAKEGSE